MLFELLHGNNRTPFSFFSRDKVVNAILNHNDDVGIKCDSHVSKDAEKLINLILKVNPEKRPSFE